MKRLHHWVRAWLGAAPSPRPVRRHTRLAVESLEDRVVPSLTTDPRFTLWSGQHIKLDDATLHNSLVAQAASTSASPTNGSFGALIGLNSVLANTPYKGAGYGVAVIDTGINYNDPNLGGRVVTGWNFVANNSNYLDDNGHGTFVAGEIGSSSATYSGVVRDVNLVALKVLDSTGAGTYLNVLNALDWVVAHRTQYNIVAVNLSLGSGNYTVNPYAYLESDFSTLVSKGVFIAVAAGNDYYTDDSTPGLDYPAVSPNVVSVGAVWDGNFGSVAWANGARDYNTAPDQIASFSQRDSALSILAPGAIITGDALKGGTTTMAGTSMASPVIAGAAVLLHEALVDDGLGASANQAYILHLMQSTGKSILDVATGTDNVKHTGLTFKRLDLAAALAAIGNSSHSPPHQTQPPTLPAIPNQTARAGQALTIPLNASDPNGLVLTYSATVQAGTSQAYQLKTSLGLQYPGSYYTNLLGDHEKWLYNGSSVWYCVLPDGELRRWGGSMSATLTPSALVATLGPSYYANPALLWNAQPATAPATVSVSNGVLTVQTNATFQGSFTVQVTVSNGTYSTSQSFSVTVSAGSTSGTPTLGSLPNQTVAGGQAVTVQLNGTDPSGQHLTYSASVTTTSSLALQLKASLGLEYFGSYDTNLMGANEKWLTSNSGLYYCIMPNGDLRQWKGNWTNTLAAGALVAKLGAAYYANPSLLWNALAITVPATLTVTGSTLVIRPTSTFRGTFVVQVTVSNGSKTTTQTFTVTVTA
jgi:subtilisin family serine protease